MTEKLDFILTLSNSDGRSIDAINALHQLVENNIGVRLFTLTTFDISSGKAQRIYSNMPNDYPVSGVKDIAEGPWTEAVITKGNVFVANTIKEISKVFDDYKLIKNLGCESVVNIPIFLGEKLLGTLNCLHEEGYYTNQRIAAFNEIQLPAIVCFLLHKLEENTEK